MIFYSPELDILALLNGTLLPGFRVNIGDPHDLYDVDWIFVGYL